MARSVVKTGFEFEKMLELSPSEARKLFITQYFLPLAMDKIVTSADPICCMLAIYRTPDDKTYQPIIAHAPRAAQGIPVLGSNFGAKFVQGLPVGDQSYKILHDRIMGKQTDVEQQSKALRHGFSECFSESTIDSIIRCPLIASVYKVDNVYKLNVVCKTQSSVPTGIVAGYKSATAQSVLRSWMSTQSEIIKFSQKYSMRPYNALTGKWIGLCPKETACKECAAIYSSPAADNVYKDLEAYEYI